MLYSAGKAAQMLLNALPVVIVYDPRVRERAREIAEQFNQERVYDATYAALAELRGCEFWTADKAFFDTVSGTLTFIKFIGNY
jgi:predicted nucleic acid-binding protein